MANEGVPISTLPYPPIHKDKKFVALSDWSVCGPIIIDQLLANRITNLITTLSGMGLSPLEILMIVWPKYLGGISQNLTHCRFD